MKQRRQLDKLITYCFHCSKVNLWTFLGLSYLGEYICTLTWWIHALWKWTECSLRQIECSKRLPCIRMAARTRKRTGILSGEWEHATSNRVHLRPRQVERTNIQHLRLIKLWSNRYCQARLHLKPWKRLAHLHLPVQGSRACIRPGPCCGNESWSGLFTWKWINKHILYCNIPSSTFSFVACFFFFFLERKRKHQILWLD